MSRLMLFLICLLGVGCNGGSKSYNVADPVVGPAPPRIAHADSTKTAQVADNDAAPGGVQQASFESDAPLTPTSVVAKANGRPILAGEIFQRYPTLEDYQRKLDAAVKRGALPEQERNERIRAAQEQIIQKDLDQMIEQVLMADAVKQKLKTDQLESINSQLDEFFETEMVANLKRQFKVDSSAELEAILQRNGMSLSTMRDMFGDKQMAQQYIQTRIGEDPQPSRKELLQRYNKQLEDYARPLQVKWQQLQISFDEAGGRRKAREQMDAALAELAGGTSFDDVVKAYSHGPLKENGGHWDWTQPVSVASDEVRAALTSLKPGEKSDVIESSQALTVVKVTDRREPGHQPFDEVQEDIRQQIIVEYRQSRAKEIIKEVRDAAVIETMFDGRPSGES